MLKSQNELLKNWHLKLLLLSGLILPTITATGAYYDLKGKLTQASEKNDARISEIELQARLQFVDKTTLKDMQDEQRAMHDDILQIKTLLTKRLK